MDANQFDRLGLSPTSPRKSPEFPAYRTLLEQTKLVRKLIKQTTRCHGSSALATRLWLDDISLAFYRVGQEAVIEVASSTVTGPLRKEVERYMNDTTVHDNIACDAIPWVQVCAHVITNFLNIAEPAAL